MTQQPRLHLNRRVNEIFLPSDFSEGSEVAFLHALKISLASKAALSIMHVREDASDSGEFPGVRETLERWGILPKGSSRHAVTDLGIDVRKIVASSKDPVAACLSYLEVNEADLIVLSVHQREGIMRWIGKSVGEPIARGAKQMTLFIPNGIKGFVSREDGSVSLRNILIPIASKPDPQPAVEAVIRLIESLGLPAGTVTLLRVLPQDVLPTVDLPEDSAWKWNRVEREGVPAHVILETADQIHADLIVMTTDGPDGFLDGLRGTTSERVLSRAKCPIGNLPVDSLLG